MQKIIDELVVDFNSKNENIKDPIQFLKMHKQTEVTEHSRKVAAEAEKLAD